jgi:hypothetical protein
MRKYYLEVFNIYFSKNSNLRYFVFAMLRENHAVLGGKNIDYQGGGINICFRPTYRPLFSYESLLRISEKNEMPPFQLHFPQNIIPCITGCPFFSDWNHADKRKSCGITCFLPCNSRVLFWK